MSSGDADALVEQLFGAAVGAFDLLHVWLGDELGLYDALRNQPQSAAELSVKAKISPRYAREWLEHQCVAGIVMIDEPGSSEDRRFALPEEHAEVLLDRDSLAYMAPLAKALVGMTGALPEVVDAFRSGGGVPYEAYGEQTRHFIAGINRPQFVNLLASDWFPSVPGLTDRLDVGARVLDIGCGTGWSTVSIAKGFPNARVTGVDLDAASTREAEQIAAAQNVGDRTEFLTCDARDLSHLDGGFDLVCAFETIHDMPDPVGALRSMRSQAADDGIVLVVDERVADEFTTEVEDGERLLWGFSTIHCLPCALSAEPAAGTGTIMRPATLEKYATEAGFASIQVLPIDNDFWRFYQLHR